MNFLIACFVKNMYNLIRRKFGIGNGAYFRMWVREFPFNYVVNFVCK